MAKTKLNQLKTTIENKLTEHNTYIASIAAEIATLEETKRAAEEAISMELVKMGERDGDLIRQNRNTIEDCDLQLDYLYKFLEEKKRAVLISDEEYTKLSEDAKNEFLTPLKSFNESFLSTMRGMFSELSTLREHEKELNEALFTLQTEVHKENILGHGENAGIVWGMVNRLEIGFIGKYLDELKSELYHYAEELHSFEV